jgi:hypothetical protein
MIKQGEWSTRFCGLIGMLLVTTSASAHDQWANGKPIPDWVKQACCAENYQTIDERRVHRLMGSDPLTNKWGPLGYKVDGFHNIVPVDRRFDSEDGLTWIFYGLPYSIDEFVSDMSPAIYCLFTNEGS